MVPDSLVPWFSWITITILSPRFLQCNKAIAGTKVPRISNAKRRTRGRGSRRRKENARREEKRAEKGPKADPLVTLRFVGNSGMLGCNDIPRQHSQVSDYPRRAAIFRNASRSIGWRLLKLSSGKISLSYHGKLALHSCFPYTCSLVFPDLVLLNRENVLPLTSCHMTASTTFPMGFKYV